MDRLDAEAPPAGPVGGDPGAAVRGRGRRGGGGRWARLRSPRRPGATPSARPGSAALFAAAQRSLPGGDSRSTLYHAPHPLFADQAAGSRVWDVDGHELVDLTNNHTALVHGNAHPVVLDAVRSQLDAGDLLLRPDGPPGGGGGPSDESAARARAGPLLRLRVRGHPPRRAGRPGVHRPARRSPRRKGPTTAARTTSSSAPTPAPTRRGPGSGRPRCRVLRGSDGRPWPTPWSSRSTTSTARLPSCGKSGLNWRPCSSSR